MANNPVGHRLTKAYDKKPIKVPTATTDANVGVQPFLLPSESEIKDLHGKDTEAARKDLERIGMYGKRNESQGVYVYRHDRLIQWGGWHQMWNTCDEKTKLARVVVDFGRELDDAFSVNISKQQVTLPQYLQEHIKRLAEDARKDSRKKYMDDKPKRAKKSAKPKDGDGGVGTGGPVPGGNGESTPKGGAAGETGDGKPKGKTKKIVSRSVKAGSFCWKITRSMTGAEEIQISEGEKELQALFDAVSQDDEAVGSLAEFLRRLDKVGVQELISDGSGRK